MLPLLLRFELTLELQGEAERTCTLVDIGPLVLIGASPTYRDI